MKCSRAATALASGLIAALLPLIITTTSAAAAATARSTSVTVPGRTSRIDSPPQLSSPEAASGPATTSPRPTLARRFSNPTRVASAKAGSESPTSPRAETAQPQTTVANPSLLNILTFSGTSEVDNTGGIEPPDGAVAVGTTHVVEMVNARATVYTRAGVQVSAFNLDPFFGLPAGGSQFTSDPRVLWDPTGSRFWASVVVVTVDATGAPIASELRVAFSQTNTALGSWTIRTAVPANGGRLYDQPRLGVSSDKVVLAWDEFDSTGAVLGGAMRALDQAQLVGGGATDVFDVPPSTARFGIVPAVNSSTTATEWAVYNGTCPDPTGCSLVPFVGVLRITGVPSAHTTQVAETQPSFQLGGTGIPPNGVQPGTTAKIDTGDDRFNSASFDSNRLWMSGNDCSVTPFPDGTCPSPGRSALRFVEVNTSGASPSVAQDIKYSDPTNSADLYYAGVAQDAAGGVMAGFSFSSSAAFPSFGATGKAPGQAFRPRVTLSPGTGPYNPPEIPPGSQSRWGDYAGAAQDPVHPTDVWVEAEWEGDAANASDWSTGISRLSLSAPTVLSVTPTGGTKAGGTSVVLAGSDFVGVTAVSFGGTAAASFTVNSPDQITAVTPASVSPGAVGVTVANANGTSPALGGPSPTFTFGDVDISMGLVLQNSPVAGGTAQFQATVTNNTATDPVSSVNVTLSIPNGTQLVSTGAGCTSTTTTVTCDVGTLAASQAVSIPLVLSRCTTGGPFTVNASVTAPQDTTPANNTDSQSATFASGSTPCAPTGVQATGGVSSANVSWTAPPDPGGGLPTQYNVHAFSNNVEVGSPTQVNGTPAPTSTTVHGLPPGTYVFTVDAKIGANPASPQSAPSGAVSVVGPASISGVSPGVARTGAGQATLTISGSGFTPSSTVQVPGLGINSVTFVSVNQLNVNVGFSNVSERRAYDITVTNPTGSSSTCGGCFSLIRSGYWMVGEDGSVYSFGDAQFRGTPNGSIGPRRGSGVRAVSIVSAPSGDGYCIADNLGEVFCFNAPAYPSLPGGNLQPGEQVTSISLQPNGPGIWFFTNRGRVFALNGAPFFGDMAGRPLNGPVLGSIPTPTGGGYYMVASDGGVFSFGDARFFGSMGGRPLNGPVKGLAPTPTNGGYWLVASDGGIFAFGDAPFRGSMGGRPLNKPVIGMVPFGNGYLMVASDGGIFDFSDKPFDGSLGSSPPAIPIANVAPQPG